MGGTCAGAVADTRTPPFGIVGYKFSLSHRIGAKPVKGGEWRGCPSDPPPGFPYGAGETYGVARIAATNNRPPEDRSSLRACFLCLVFSCSDLDKRKAPPVGG